MNYTVQDIRVILDRAQAAAEQAAAQAYEQNGNTDWDACGFAWVNIYKVKGNTKLGKALKAAGVRQDYTRAFQVWNPGGYGGQSISIKEAAARAYARVLEGYGFTAYAGSRLD